MRLKLFVAAAAVSVLAGAAGAETVAYECKISQRTTGDSTKVYDESERARPELRERFAFDVAAGRGCLVVEDTCDGKIGWLAVEQDESSIVGRKREPQVLLTYMIARQQYVLIVGDETRYSLGGDCHRIMLDPHMP